MRDYVLFRLDRLEQKLDAMLGLLQTVIAKEKEMAGELDALTAQVTANTSAEASAITLLNGLAAQIASLKNDPVAIQNLANQLKTSADSLGAAIVANTPAA